MKHELTKCPECGRVLVSYEQVHAIDGMLFCSKACAINHLTEEYTKNAQEMAIEAYASNAEVVSTDEVLSEDLQEVKITVTITKVIKLPKNLNEAEAVSEACILYNQGLITMDVDDCDKSTVEYELVKNDNSSCDEDA